MAKAKCVICGKPAKRVCLGKDNRPVCSACCRKMFEDPHQDCPAGCPFAAEAHAYAEEKLYERIAQLLRQEPANLFLNMGEESFTVLGEVLGAMRSALAQNEYTDSELLTALASLRYELMAARSRLIFDGSPLGGNAQLLFRQLRTYLESHERKEHKHEEEQQPRQEAKEFVLDKFKRENVEEALNLLERLIRHHEAPDGKGYIKFFLSVMT